MRNHDGLLHRITHWHSRKRKGGATVLMCGPRLTGRCYVWFQPWAGGEWEQLTSGADLVERLASAPDRAN